MLFDASALLLPAQLMATTETVLLVSPVNVYSGAPMDGVGVIDTDTVAGSSGNTCPGHC